MHTTHGMVVGGMIVAGRAGQEGRNVEEGSGAWVVRWYLCLLIKSSLIFSLLEEAG